MANKVMNASNHDYFVVNAAFFDDARLSLTDIGLLTYMLSRRSKGKFTPENLSKKRDMDVAVINAALSSLNRNGYFRKVKLINKNGMFIDWIYDVSDTRHPEWIGTEATEISDGKE